MKLILKSSQGQQFSKTCRPLSLPVHPLKMSFLSSLGFQKELNKFGLKPTLGKSKAKLLLRHIYNQTHPYVDSSDDESRTKPSKRRKTDPKVPTDRLRQVSTGSSFLTRDDNNRPSVARLQKKKSPEKQKNTRRVQVNERAVALDKAECNSSDAGESESETSNR